MNPPAKPAVLRVFPPVLEKGAKGRAVILLKLLLAPLWNQLALGQRAEGTRPIDVTDPFFDESLEKAVRWFQFSLRMGSGAINGKLDAPTRSAIMTRLGVDLDALTLDIVIGTPTYLLVAGTEVEWCGTSADDPRNMAAAA